MEIIYLVAVVLRGFIKISGRAPERRVNLKQGEIVYLLSQI